MIAPLRTPLEHGFVTRELATELVRRHLDSSLTVTSVRQLNGGMVHHVSEWATDGEPHRLVAKMNTPAHADALRREMATLRWYRDHTRLPVPEPYGWLTEPGKGVSALLMESIPGRTLADAKLSSRGGRLFQTELAEHLAALHDHHSDGFGSVLEPRRHRRWVDAFAPALEEQFASVRSELSSRTRGSVEELLIHLDDWLGPDATPALVHGDLWATNIMVDDAHPDQPRTLAFIDCNATYCDPEFELAYLRLFNTADETFFGRYVRAHPLREGFDRRCRIYWLHTLLVHVQLFGARYVPACEQVVSQLRRLG